MADTQGGSGNEKTGTSWRRREISDKAQENRNELRTAMAQAGVSALSMAQSQTSRAAHRHVENKGAVASQSRSSDAGQYLSS